MSLVIRLVMTVALLAAVVSSQQASPRRSSLQASPRRSRLQASPRRSSQQASPRRLVRPRLRDFALPSPFPSRGGEQEPRPVTTPAPFPAPRPAAVRAGCGRRGRCGHSCCTLRSDSGLGGAGRVGPGTGCGSRGRCGYSCCTYADHVRATTCPGYGQVYIPVLRRCADCLFSPHHLCP